MRIAYITQSYPPMVSGASLVAKNLAENMVTRGHQVLVIAASDHGESYKTINGKLIVLRLRSFHNPLRVGQRFALSPHRAFMQTLQDFRPDVIHSHDALQLGLLCLMYKRKYATPTLLTTHALPNFAAKSLPDTFSGFQTAIESSLWMYAWWILRQFDTITTPTITTSGMIRAMTKIQPLSISNGVNLDTFCPTHLTPDCETTLRIRFGLPPDIPVILHVGRLDTDKRVDMVIRAAARSMQTTNAHLLVVGDGCQKPALLKLCKSLGIETRCHFPGYISVEEGLPGIYRLAHIFVTASEIETQGIVLLEAAASGLPIAAIRATCIHEIVHNGLNGYLIDSKNCTALGKAITELLIDPNKARLMGRAGRRLVKEHDVLATFDSYENLYADLISQYAIQTSSENDRDYSWQKRAKKWLDI